MRTAHSSESTAIVSAKVGSIRNIDTGTIDDHLPRDIVRKGYLPEQCYVPDLSDFLLRNVPMDPSVKKLLRNRVLPVFFDLWLLIRN